MSKELLIAAVDALIKKYAEMNVEIIAQPGFGTGQYSDADEGKSYLISDDVLPDLRKLLRQIQEME